MALYKGVEIDDGLAGLVGHMGEVDEYRESLQALQAVWDSLALLGHLSGTGADMSETRGAFQGLTGKLLNQLGRETLKKTAQEMNSKAQVAVDIMVRNLFERTADIGFLAMDGELRDYLRLHQALRARGDNGDAAAAQDLVQASERLVERFDAYVRKYSVYSNVVLLDTQGNILLQLGRSRAQGYTRDPLVAESLSTSAAYVETFRKSDLLEDEEAGLIYSSRVVDASSGAALGVLCLCFRFANEAQQIFTKLADVEDWSVITLLDAQGRVIASGDPHHIPVGAVLPRVLDADWKVLRFAGRQYLATTRATQGYQGYAGPGWVGHVMLPLAHAFEQKAGQAEVALSEDVLEAVTGNARLFSAALRDIPVQARRIQRGLNRSVWNGSVKTNAVDETSNPAFSKVLLWEISNTGFKTQDVFERSIANLHQTVVSSLLQESGFRAALAIDIMDRNLYERANDCRWWALAPVFGRLLRDSEPDAALLAEATQTLEQINGLYTVYDNLVLFDKAGQVRAVSNPKYGQCIGQALEGDWVRQSLSLADGQGYAVSPFAPSPLYDGRHTYVYAAAIFDPQRAREVVGGIGIVFDAAPQFTAMLQDALPRDEQGQVAPGCFGVFADRGGQVIASTDARHAPGASLALDEKFLRLDNGAALSGMAILDNAHYAIGAATSAGYREYKGDGDPYKNDVTALIFVPLGEKRAGAHRHAHGRHGASRARLAAGHTGRAGRGIEVATFYVDGHWVGIPAQMVVEAIDMQSMARSPSTDGQAVNYLMYRGQLVPVVGLGAALGTGGEAHAHPERQIVVLQLAPQYLLGVMVDELGEITDIGRDRIETIAGILGGEEALTEGLVKPEEGRSGTGMIMLLSPARLQKRYLGADQPG